MGQWVSVHCPSSGGGAGVARSACSDPPYLPTGEGPWAVFHSPRAMAATRFSHDPCPGGPLWPAGRVRPAGYPAAAWPERLAVKGGAAERSDPLTARQAVLPRAPPRPPTRAAAGRGASVRSASDEAGTAPPGGEDHPGAQRRGRCECRQARFNHLQVPVSFETPHHPGRHRSHWITLSGIRLSRYRTVETRGPTPCPSPSHCVWVVAGS